MALNKPRYTLFKNTRYALNGLLEVTKNEKSFRLQLLLFVVGTIVAWSLPILFLYKAILSVSLFIPLIAEVINSAIERTVDLVTLSIMNSPNGQKMPERRWYFSPSDA
jgi:diacylglycerol kinase (ATP)